MPARTPGMLITKDRFGNRGVETDRRNFELFNDPNGAQGQRDYLAALSAADQQRTGPVMGLDINSLNAQRQSAGAQNAYADALRQQAMGTGFNPAIAQNNMGMRTAQGNNLSLAAGSGGYDMAAAKRAAAWGNADLAAQTAQQNRMLQAQSMAFGRDAYGQFSDAMRGQDLSMRGTLQENAVRQAQLEDEQRARNDAMAQFYLEEQGRLRRGQSQANQNYESQDAASKLGVSNMNQANRIYDQQQNDRATAAGAAAIGSGLATVAKTGAEAEEAERRRRAGDTGAY